MSKCLARMEECLRSCLYENIGVFKITFVCNRTLIDLILVVLNLRDPTQKKGNGNSNEIEDQSQEIPMKVIKNNVTSDGYGINGKVVTMSIINENFEDEMTKEEQHMVSQSLNYLSLNRGHPL